ncbi:hypothetical protein SAMN04487894_110175 [Niabella drilacis]|uniref:Uncharacterized protein n=2 Tax=Niabella drilacis (strain DSM 25811 / CCM 8410 / CCUG 62505 / LMG 26954 / E90) TaxID=1285928 RepID=A0A1G6VWD5_NIADE|nr:hypothetical protein SAMN04487894_110175 [Niabella drilacis]
MYKVIFCVLLPGMLLFSMAVKGSIRDAIVRLPVSDTLLLLGDSAFEKGLVLKGTNTNAVCRDRFIFPFGENNGRAQWELAEWGSRFQLAGIKRRIHRKRIIYATRGKKIAFEKPAGNCRVAMNVTASDEYPVPRKAGEDWAHLLVEQTFTKKPYLKDLEALIFKFSGRLTKAVLRMKKKDFDPGLHTAQFQLFITVQDLNPASPNHGDFLWFGIPFYDYRYKDIRMYAAQDLGKSDATGKFIYSMGSADFMKGSFHSGAWITIYKDILPMMKDAVKLAKQRGYLKGSAIEDLGVSSMNLGWEVPGTLDVGFEFKGLDLLGVLRP